MAPKTVTKKTVAKAPNRAEAYKAGVLADRLSKTKRAKTTKEGSPAKKSPAEVRYDARVALGWEGQHKKPLGTGRQTVKNFVSAGMKRRGK